MRNDDEERVGTILHFWPRVGAAQLGLDGAALRVGDRIRIRGHGRDFVQEVFSLEIDQVAREQGSPGELVSIGVLLPVKENDEVYRLRRT